METQVCNKCGDEKALDLFIKHAYYPSGRGKTCKKCASAASQRRKDKTREKANEKDREKRQANSDVAAAKAAETRAYYAANKDKIKAQRKANRDAKPEQYRQYVRDSLARNPHLRAEDNLRKKVLRVQRQAEALANELAELKNKKKRAPKTSLNSPKPE